MVGLTHRHALAALLLAALVCPLHAEPAPPLYSSTADTVFDIIRSTDPHAFACLESAGRKVEQIWDRRVDGEPFVNSYSFVAAFRDSSPIVFAVNPEFGSLSEARQEAVRYAISLGQLPLVLRNGIKRVSIHKGDEGFHAGTGQIVLYADRATRRIAANHLEESIFHEAVHASLDDTYRVSVGWIGAQHRDAGFLTEYASSAPDREDLAETALFAYALQYHPERIPPNDTRDINAAIPNRLSFIRDEIFTDPRKASLGPSGEYESDAACGV